MIITLFYIQCYLSLSPLSLLYTYTSCITCTSLCSVLSKLIISLV